MNEKSLNSWKIIINKISNDPINKGIHSFVNPYSMLKLENLLEISSSIDYWHIDGISLVNKVNSKLNKKFTRLSFDDTSMAPIIFSFAKKNNLKIGIIGTKEEFIYKAVNNIIKKYGVNVQLIRNGYFKDNDELEAVCNNIILNKIDIVICGMGTPFQENFLMTLKKMGWIGYGYTCGGYLHQMAKAIDYYPRFFNYFNIRWVFRIIDEPKLLSRYMFDYPKFFIKFSSMKNL